MVVAGHSYKSIFGKLSSNLTEGDIIYFKSLAGNIYKYKLDNIEYLLPTDVQEMQNGDWDFTVFTCSYDNQKRIAYRFIESD
jgi:sortase A